MITPKWKLYEDYKKQDEAGQKRSQKYLKLVQQAQEEVNVSEANYGRILNLEFEGEDVSEQKKEALQAIESAIAALEVARNEHNKVHEYNRQNTKRITAKELTLDWNHNICPTIREEQLNPIVKRMREGLEEYYNGLLDYYELVGSYSLLERKLRDLEHNRHRALGEVMYSISSVSTLNDVPKPSNSDMLHIANNKTLPSGYDRKGIK